MKCGERGRTSIIDDQEQGDDGIKNSYITVDGQGVGK